MPKVAGKRTLDTAATRTVLLDAGLRLFAERGYPNVPGEDLVRKAGPSRGALYHHFGGNPGLFCALVVQLQDDAATRIRVAIAGGGDVWASAVLGGREFLSICAEPVYREIVLLQGPAGLGWDAWRELDQDGTSSTWYSPASRSYRVPGCFPHTARNSYLSLSRWLCPRAPWHLAVRAGCRLTPKL